MTKIQRRRKQRQPTVASGIQEIMSGIGFFVVSLMVMRFAPAGRIWWFWLLIPAFINLGKGISEIMRSRQTSFADQIPAAQLRPGAPPPSNLTAPPTGELLAAPPSVTERTTRHLGMEAPTQNRDASDELRK